VAGSYVATLVVNDGKVNSTTAAVTVIASTANSAPVANAGTAQSVTTGAVVTLNGAGSTDANGDTLTYRWTLASRPTSSTAALSSATAASPTFTADLSGTYVANLIVNDGKVDSSNVGTVAVTAASANSAPVANAGTNQTVARVNGTITITLNGTGSTDANGDTLTYRWTIAYQPSTSTATLSSSTAASPTITATVAGVYVFNLVVNDGKVDSSAVASVSVTVS
jgi:YD repeat-containing protein